MNHHRHSALSRATVVTSVVVAALLFSTLAGAAEQHTGTTAQAGGRPPRPLTCSTTGPQNTVVLMVTMPGAPLPTDATPSVVNDIFFSNGGGLMSLNDYWRENSYGATTVTGTVAPGPNGGWYTLDQVYTEAQRSEIRAAAIQAADANVDFTQYTRLFIVINGMAVDSSAAGWATSGCSSLSSGDGSFNASTSWMRGSSMGENFRGTHLAAAVGGSNLGLLPADSRDFGAEALGAPGVAGDVGSHDDVFSVMGRSFGHYAAPQKAELGWLPTQILTVTTSGIYTVQPAEAPGSVLALKIRRGADNNNWIWLEFRQPLGLYDSKLSAPFVYGLAPSQIFYPDAADSHIYGGGLIHYQDALTTGKSTQLLDMTPGSLSGSTGNLVDDDWLDTPLAGSWTDAYTGLTITTSNPTSSSLTVQVTYGAGPCVQSNPSVSISPSNPTAKRGQNVVYTVTVMNNDTAPCLARTFDLASSLPSGWLTSFSSSVVTLAPSSSTTVSMTKTVPAAAAFTTFPVNASATRGAYTGVGNASVTVKQGK